MANVFALIKKHQEDLAARKSRIKPEKVPEGESTWRILPHPDEVGAADTEKKFWQDFGVHYVKQINAEGKEEFDAFVCEDKTFQADCPVCQAIFSTLNDISTYDEVRKGRVAKPGYSQAMVTALDESKASARIIVNAIRVDVAPGTEQKPVMLELSIKTWEALVAATSKRHQMKGTNAFSTTKGLNVYFTREGKGRTTKYQVDLDIDITAIKVDPEQMADLESFATRQRDEGREKVLKRLNAISGGKVALSGASKAAAFSGPSALVSETTHAMAREVAPVRESAAVREPVTIDPDEVGQLDIASTQPLEAADFHEVSRRSAPAVEERSADDLNDEILRELESLA